MNLLSLLPEKYQPTADLIIGAVPFLKCALEGHAPVPNVTLPLTTEGVRRTGRLCTRCNLVYWEQV